MGVARIFQRGGGGHTESYRGYSPDCHLNIAGCLLTKRLTKRGGSHAPQDPRGYALGMRSFTMTICGIITLNLRIAIWGRLTNEFHRNVPDGFLLLSVNNIINGLIFVCEWIGERLLVY